MDIYKDFDKYHDANGLCADRLPPKVDFNNWLWTAEECLAKHLNGALDAAEMQRFRDILLSQQVKPAIFRVPGFDEPQSHDNLRGIIIIMWLCAPDLLDLWVGHGLRTGWSFAPDGKMGSESMGRFAEIPRMAKLARGFKLDLWDMIFYLLYPAKMLFNPRRIEPKKWIYFMCLIGETSKQKPVKLVCTFWLWVYKNKYGSLGKVIASWGEHWAIHPSAKWLN